MEDNTRKSELIRWHFASFLHLLLYECCVHLGTELGMRLLQGNVGSFHREFLCFGEMVSHVLQRKSTLLQDPVCLNSSI